jgi:hypothetical protein
MFVAGFVASLLIVTVAAKDPGVLGANCKLSAPCCPGSIVTGRLGPVTEKYLVETDALLIVIGTVPKLVAVIVCSLLLPAFTLPKSTL